VASPIFKLHGTKTEQAIDQTIFPLRVRKIGWGRD